MNCLLRLESGRTAAVLTVLASVLFSMDIRADDGVRCTCPEIKADGYGQTACSANESGSRCRVAYNQFARGSIDRALRAFNEAGQKPQAVENLSFRDIPPSQRFQFLDEKARVEAVSVSAAMAAAYAGAFSKDDAQQLYAALMHGSVRDFVSNSFNKEAVERGRRALQSGASGFDKARAFDPPNAKVFVSDGCVVVRTSRNWFMYKTEWSPARSVPYCG
jgi:hypothetical protein